MRRRTLLGGLAGFAALGLAGCGRESAAPHPRALRMACDPWAGYYPAVLASIDGQFERAGLRVTLERSTSTDRMLADFAAGRYDIVSASIGDFVPMAARDRDLALLLSSDESAGADQVFQRRGFDPGAPGRLRLGTDLNGFGELFMRDFLAQSGMAGRDVLWLHVDAADAGEALDLGRIDYANSWEPFAAQLAARGHTKVFDSSRTPALVTQVLVAKRHAVAEDPAAFGGFRRAWFEAVDAWLADPAAGSRRIEAALGLAPGEASLDGIRLHTRADNDRLLGGHAPELAPVVARYAAFHAARGQSPGDLGFLFDGVGPA